MAEGSTTLDKWALVISILAIIVSIGSPFITYRWLQNDVRVQQLKADALRATATSVMVHAFAPKSFWGVQTMIKQEGVLPVDRVKVDFEAKGPKTIDFFKNAEIKTSPFYKTKFETHENAIEVMFEEPLPPKENIVLLITTKVVAENFDEPGFTGWIRSEASPAIPIFPPPPPPSISSVGGNDSSGDEKYLVPEDENGK